MVIFCYFFHHLLVCLGSKKRLGTINTWSSRTKTSVKILNYIYIILFFFLIFSKYRLQYRKRFYYFAIFSNFILRLVWVLSISPDIIDSLGEYNITTEIFTFFVYFLESLRRCQWNFFRVENEHVKNFANFKAVSDLGLPMCPYMEPEDENT